MQKTSNPYMGRDYEQLTFLKFALTEPRIFKNYYKGLYLNRDVDYVAEYAHKFYELNAVIPNKDTLLQFINATDNQFNTDDQYARSQTDIINAILDTDISRIDTKHLKTNTINFYKNRYSEKKLFMSVEMLKTQYKDTQLNADVIELAIQKESEKYNINIDSDDFVFIKDAYKNSTIKTKVIKTNKSFINESPEGGYQKGQMITYAGASGTGKSTFLCDDAAFYCLSHLNVLYLTFEQDCTEISNRIYSNMCDIEIQEWYLKSKLEKESIFKKMNDKFIMPIGELIIYRANTHKYTIKTLKEQIDEIKRNYNITIDVVILDYINHVGDYTTPKAEDRVRIGNVAEQLKDLSMKSNFLAITATQTNRQFAKGDSFMKHENISESSKIAWSSDELYGIIRTADQEANGINALQIIKSRNIPENLDKLYKFKYINRKFRFIDLKEFYTIK